MNHIPNRELRLHFVGIGGIGMSGIAEMFLNQGYMISGSDLSESEITRRLVAKGAKVFKSHDAQNVVGAQVVVTSSAVKKNNPEVQEARRQRIPVIPRAEMLAELMRGKTGIAIAGTHGKTTTTSLMATVLENAGLDPTAVIGGVLNAFGSNAKLGTGEYVVAEADESDGSFLTLPATYGVITNIDNDHLDYYQTMASIEDAFVSFVSNMPFYGLTAVCQEDAGVQRILTRLNKPFVTYGFTAEADWRGSPAATGPESSMRVAYKGKELGAVTLQIPGNHNLLNALGVIAIASRLGVSFNVIAEGLSAFKGVGRRFEVKWRDLASQMAVVDDYGHHPTEIAAVLAAAKKYWPSGRVVTVFQPHRYSRTEQCLEGFKRCFSEADVLLMTEIYAAGEDPIEGIDGERLTREVQAVSAAGKEIEFVGSLELAEKRMLDIVQKGDLVLCLGAGSITKLSQRLSDQISARYGSK